MRKGDIVAFLFLPHFTSEAAKGGFKRSVLCVAEHARKSNIPKTTKDKVLNRVERSQVIGRDAAYLLKNWLTSSERLRSEYCLISIPLHLVGPFSEKVPMAMLPSGAMNWRIVSKYFWMSASSVKK